jgi:hypothetical protein
MRRAVLIAAAAALSLSSCGGELERDDRVRFLTPPEGARVTLPLVLRWEAEGFRARGFDGSRTDDRGVYAVFVDSAPMRPGEHLDSLARGDRTCEATPGCPDRTWLADRGVHLTTQPFLALQGLPSKGGRSAPGGRRHQVTVVLLDGRGVRVGEGAWTRSFTAPEAGA